MNKHKWGKELLQNLFSVQTYKALYLKVRSRGLLATIAIASALVLVLSSGVGATLAATGVIAFPSATQTPNPTIIQTPTSTPTPTPKETFPSPGTEDGLRAYEGEGFTAIGGRGKIGFKWSGSSLMVVWNGKCTAGPITVKVGPPNWGYLSQPVAGIQGLGGTGSSQICNGFEGGGGIGTGDSASYWKCFGFNEVWVEVSGDSPDAGLYKLPMPSNIQAQNCPAGSELNNPNVVWDISTNQGYGNSPYNTPPAPEPAPPAPEPAPPAPEPSPTQEEPSSTPTPAE